jgi:anti-anti-sigma factor
MTFHGDVVFNETPLRLPIEVRPVGDDVVAMIIHGDVDLTEAGELRAVLNDACTGPHHTVVVDLSEVCFMGSSGMGVLAEVHHRLATEGRQLLVEHAAPAIATAFEIAGVVHVLGR